jgi:hypothetical protein
MEIIVPGERRFVAQAIVERQARANLKRVLDKERENDVPIVLERTPPLRESAEAAEQKVGRGGAGVVAATAMVPGFASSINVVFSKVNSVMILAASS